MSSSEKIFFIFARKHPTLNPFHVLHATTMRADLPQALQSVMVVAPFAAVAMDYQVDLKQRSNNSRVQFFYIKEIQ